MELPFKALLAVLLFSFTAALSYKALDAHQSLQEKVTARITLDSFALKTKEIAMGSYGTRELVEIRLMGLSKLSLYNEEFNEGLHGVARIELSRGDYLLKILPMPIWGSRDPPRTLDELTKNVVVYPVGHHQIAITHLAANISGTKTSYLLVR